MKLTNDWFTAFSESDDGKMIIICGRDGIDAFMQSGKFKERAEISWKYTGDANGMPSDAVAETMEKVQDALQKKMEKDKLAVMTGVYTGENERLWVFYTRNVPAFGVMLNETLMPFEELPITIYTEKDPQWEEYQDMYESKSEVE